MARLKRVSRIAALRLVLAAAVSLMAVSPARSQEATFDPRWQAWLGCWQPAAPAPDAEEAVLVCMIPTAGSTGVTMVTLERGAETARQQFDATGKQLPITRDGCDGWETAQFSADERRVYLRSELACPGGVQRLSNAVLAISREGDWIGIESVNVADGSVVRVTRYRDAGLIGNAPIAITNALADRRLAFQAARIAAGAPVGATAIIEATRHLPASIVQALLVEQGQPYYLTAAHIASLADAGVPGSVTDVLIALANPDQFILDRSTDEPELRPDVDDGGNRAGTRRGYDGRSGCSSLAMVSYPFGLGYGLTPFGYAASTYGNSYSYGNGYSRNAFGSRCRSRGYNPYGYGYGGYGRGWGRTPYVVVRNGSRPKGKAVNGEGYTRGNSTGATTTRTGVSRGSGVRGSSGNARGARGGSSGGSSGGRKAKPR